MTMKNLINKPTIITSSLASQLEIFSELLDIKHVQNNKLVGYTHSLDIDTTEYVKEQLELVTFMYSGLEVEISNAEDLDLSKYLKYPQRLPVFILYANGSRKAVKQGKVNNREFTDWVVSVIG
jgi:hypothetical protein